MHNSDTPPEPPDQGLASTAWARAFEDPNVSHLPNRRTTRFHGDCTRPVRIPQFEGLVELAVRCRQCPSCLRARQHQWRLRGEHEIRTHVRCWLFTGTFRSQTRDIDDVRAATTKFLDRLRTTARRRGLPKLTYLVAPEKHKSGAWHIHMLVPHDDLRVTRRFVQAAWTEGFSNCKLVGERGAGYVSKYVTKELFRPGGSRAKPIRPRIRASRGFGRAIVEAVASRVQALQAAGTMTAGFRPLQAVWNRNLSHRLDEIARRRLSSPVWHPTRKETTHGTTKPKPPGGHPLPKAHQIDRWSYPATEWRDLPEEVPR